MVSLDRLKTLLHYDEGTGVFTWVGHDKQPWINGTVAGGDSHGYVAIRIDGTLYLAHRLAWLYVHGSWPEFCIDHVNGDRGDNRLCNLRDVPHEDNTRNQRTPGAANRSGYLGVTWHKAAKKWQAGVKFKGVFHHAGTFDDPAKAHEAYVLLKRKLHTSCTL